MIVSSKLIQMICIKLNGFKYSRLTLTILFNDNDNHLFTHIYGFKHSYLFDPLMEP